MLHCYIGVFQDSMRNSPPQHHRSPELSPSDKKESNNTEKTQKKPNKQTKKPPADFTKIEKKMTLGGKHITTSCKSASSFTQADEENGVQDHYRRKSKLAAGKTGRNPSESITRLAFPSWARLNRASFACRILAKNIRISAMPLPKA